MDSDSSYQANHGNNLGPSLQGEIAAAGVDCIHCGGGVSGTVLSEIMGNIF